MITAENPDNLRRKRTDVLHPPEQYGRHRVAVVRAVEVHTVMSVR